MQLYTWKNMTAKHIKNILCALGILVGYITSIHAQDPRHTHNRCNETTEIIAATKQAAIKMGLASVAVWLFVALENPRSNLLSAVNSTFCTMYTIANPKGIPDKKYWSRFIYKHITNTGKIGFWTAALYGWYQPFWLARQYNAIGKKYIA